MQHPDEGTIHAWLDGQLPPDEAAAVEAHAAECSECSALIAEARGLIAASSRIVTALDAVPSGVIPMRPKMKRAWYASTQLRAAAAVLFVASASLLVVRDRGSAPVEDSLSRAADTPAAAIQESPQPSASVGVSAPVQPPVAAKTVPTGSAADRASTPRSVAERRAEDAGESMQATAKASAPPAEIGRAAAVERDAASGRAQFGQMLKVSPVVVTGVATDQVDEARLTLVRADTATTSIVSVYRIEDSVEVTLTEIVPAPVSVTTAMRRERRLQAAAEAAPKAAPAPPPAAPANVAASNPVISISWTDSTTRRSYVLSGRVTRERLDAIRKSIEERRKKSE